MIINKLKYNKYNEIYYIYMKLVIVESPTKVKTLGKYLGKDFTTIASVGHIRALPSTKGSVLPEENFKMFYSP